MKKKMSWFLFYFCDKVPWSSQRIERKLEMGQFQSRVHDLYSGEHGSWQAGMALAQ